MTFSKEAIESVGARLQRDLDDEKIHAILQARDSRDIQAAPGSGKTSVLGAKLTLMAPLWPYADRGICMLSHTNVAKNEIMNLLRTTNEGRQLLKWPHFLGTIQAFVDQFLAMPYIRARGLPFDALDENRHARVAKRYFAQTKYSGTRLFLSQKNISGDVYDFAGDLEYVRTLKNIRHKSFKLPSETSDTYRKLLEVKCRVSEEGVYRYHDMYAFAHAYIDQYPWIVEAIRHRFPTVFIDEMQDTSRLQFDLLSRICDRNSLVVQRFGDRDQAIYDLEGDEESGSDFPAEPILALDNSRRFGPFIAEQVTALSLSSQQVLGKGAAAAKPGTIFVFEPDTIKEVLPAFGALVLDEFEGQEVRANAVGRRRKPGSGKHIPTSIIDYWDIGDGSSTVARSYGDFTDAVKRALELSMSQASYHEATAELWRGVRAWAAAFGAEDAAALVHALRKDSAQRSAISTAFHALLVSGSFPDRTTWTKSVFTIERSINESIGASAMETPFSAYPADVPMIAPTGAQVYEHVSGDRKAIIEMNTIHGVKSQTHAATLLLETRIQGFDLKAIMPFLSGRKSVTAQSIKPAEAATIRCGFVAISRPQSLLCIAVRNDHVTSKDRLNLEDRGWRIIDLVCNSEG